MSSKAKRRRVDFGDGYSQRSALALNNIQQTWDLNWSLNTTDMQTLRAFFDTMGGTSIIDWQPPGQPAALKWTAETFSSTPDGYDNWSCSMTLVQEFDL
jgi:phage-related protein